jgi:hypothetical protein
MFASLRALLEHLIDYAGLFPPAQLPLDQALGEYARQRQQPEAWLLGPFVCPTTRLPELRPHAAELFQLRDPFPFSVLMARGGSTFADWLPGLQADLNDVSSFLQQHGSAVRVSALELRLPDDLRQASAAEMASRLSAAAGVIAKRQLPPLAVFYEAPRGADWRRLTPSLVKGLAGACLKLRCGGPTPSAVPTSAQLAFTLQCCAAAGVRLKFTAGLHHALYQPGRHGFINLFTAAVLAQGHTELSQEMLCQVLEDTRAEHFQPRADGLSWRELFVSIEQIEKARRSLALSFGSCSFDEPVEDLRSLGWLQTRTS